ncbi:glycosyltransferase family 2 protein [Candidatus Pelagibacter sp.]|mgnify:CR=1 FL=1|nr:glycosyltransferase family 2 protein [Candidatus Pelagibacter sp.]
MKLSIIIPHYNGSHFLEKLLASIPNNKNIQTIVVDDMSELLHVEAIYHLKSKYDFEFYLNDIKKSSGLCRNLGLEKAKGDWVMFADCDDYFIDGFYDVVSRYFKSRNDIVFFSPTSQYIDTGEVADRHLSFEKIIQDYLKVKTKKNELFLRFNFISPWSKMIKKEFMYMHKIKFDEGPIGAEDVILSTRIGYFMKYFDVSNDIIYCRIVRYGSITRVLNEDQFDIRLQARISRIKFLKNNLSTKDLEEVMRLFINNKAAEFLLLSLRRFGFKKFLQVYGLYKKEDIKWFRLIYLNPYKIIKYIFLGFYKFIKNKKYNKSK